MDASAAAAPASNATGTDYHASYTASYAMGSAIVDGNQARWEGGDAAQAIRMPPKQYGALSDVGYDARTNGA